MVRLVVVVEEEVGGLIMPLSYDFLGRNHRPLICWST